MQCNKIRTIIIGPALDIKPCHEKEEKKGQTATEVNYLMQTPAPRKGPLYLLKVQWSCYENQHDVTKTPLNIAIHFFHGTHLTGYSS